MPNLEQPTTVKTKEQRLRDAHAIQQGACNPTGIALAIYEHGCAMRRNGEDAGTRDICSDPAIRLMVHQLAFLCNVAEFDLDTEAWKRAMDICEKGV